MAGCRTRADRATQSPGEGAFGRQSDEGRRRDSKPDLRPLVVAMLPSIPVPRDANRFTLRTAHASVAGGTGHRQDGSPRERSMVRPTGLALTTQTLPISGLCSLCKTARTWASTSPEVLRRKQSVRPAQPRRDRGTKSTRIQPRYRSASRGDPGRTAGAMSAKPSWSIECDLS